MKQKEIGSEVIIKLKFSGIKDLQLTYEKRLVLNLKLVRDVSDTTSFRQPSIGQPSIHQLSIGKP